MGRIINDMDELFYYSLSLCYEIIELIRKKEVLRRNVHSINFSILFVKIRSSIMILLDIVLEKLVIIYENFALS